MWFTIMLKTKIVEQTITGNNVRHYEMLGYDVSKHFVKIRIPVEHLPKNSRCEVVVSCDRCKRKLKMRYETYNKYSIKQGFYACIKCKTEKTINTNKSRHGVEHVSQKLEFKIKLMKTNLKKYGVESVLQHQFFMDKMMTTNIKKYGVPLVGQLESVKEKSKQTRIKNGFQTPDELMDKLRLYRLSVDKATRKFKKQLFEEWDGYDFYDKKFIRNNFKFYHTDKRFPSIDHKTSVFYGFKNNIPADIIGDIKNLCITKRSLNSKKHSKNHLNL